MEKKCTGTAYLLVLVKCMAGNQLRSSIFLEEEQG
jgi:hypothetical protein